MELQAVKQRFGIIGNSPGLNRAIDVAMQVAPTDISVLITGESGTGKEIMPQIIHNLSSRRHGQYIAVNCGAIPEGTIDSELFGHEKGSFTGASEARKGYFEVANGGTIFLDEVAELPMLTQVRLLRVLETGEFIKVGSSKVIKTDVRIVAATNVNIGDAIARGKFREDLYYRLNTVPIQLPALRDRKEDVYLIFRKFAADFADKYRMPTIQLSDEARVLLENYRWPGNIRQLKNITEQVSVIEQNRIIKQETFKAYLPDYRENNLPMRLASDKGNNADFSEREILYKVLFDMKQDMTDLKTLVLEMMQNKDEFNNYKPENPAILQRLYSSNGNVQVGNKHNQNQEHAGNYNYTQNAPSDAEPILMHEEVEESLSLTDSEKDLIQKALKRHKNKRKYAAQELGISERTLYRKIKEYDIK